MRAASRTDDFGARGLTEAFRQAVTKESVGRSAPPPAGSDSPLPDDWCTRVPAQLETLTSVWRVAQAWDGDTEAGRVELPASVMALDEITGPRYLVAMNPASWANRSGIRR
ncbi:hypothetical protein ACFWBG_04925 [Nocardia salmonicida]|uniref:hypothetical protein n=1 Tax=Nocardia salmonicida TaxID=53431 RepID=UPI00366A82F1